MTYDAWKAGDDGSNYEAGEDEARERAWEAEQGRREAEADARAAALCACGQPVGDREPPQVDGRDVCATCWADYAVGRWD